MKKTLALVVLTILAGRLPPQPGNEAATPLEANIHAGYTPKIGTNRCIQIVAQTVPNCPFFRIVKIRVSRTKAPKNHSRRAGG
jgi:hypothetical protein